MAEVIRLESKMIGPDYCTMTSSRIVAAETSDLELVDAGSRKRDDILSKGLAALVDSSSSGLSKCGAEIAGLAAKHTEYEARLGSMEAKAAELAKSYSATGPILHSLQSSIEEHCARVNSHVTLVTRACDEQRLLLTKEVRTSLDTLARADQLTLDATALIETSRASIADNIARMAEIHLQIDSSFARAMQISSDLDRMRADFEEHKRQTEQTVADARKAVAKLEQLSATMLTRADAFAHFALRCRWDTLWGRLKWTLFGASLPSISSEKLQRTPVTRQSR